jgi:hypothetical protein
MNKSFRNYKITTKFIKIKKILMNLNKFKKKKV